MEKQWQNIVNFNIIDLDSTYTDQLYYGIQKALMVMDNDWYKYQWCQLNEKMVLETMLIDMDKETIYLNDIIRTYRQYQDVIIMAIPNYVNIL